MDKTTYFYPNKTLNFRGRIVDLSSPKVMGILNVTPDSFFDGGKFNTVSEALKQVEKMLNEGADMVDIGGMSSRPGAETIDSQTEIGRILPVIIAIAAEFPGLIFSVDTIHSSVAQIAIDNGASMINDISAAKFDSEILSTAGKSNTPYVLMHMKGSPKDMQKFPTYNNVAQEIFEFLIQKSNDCIAAGIKDIIIDPGFGFGKTLEQNYQLVNDFEIFQQIGLPVMAGISRKSLICKLLKVSPENALNGSTSLHTILLMKGANILRVHDVREAIEAVRIVEMTKKINFRDQIELP